MMNMYSKMILPKKCQTVTFTQLAVVKRVSCITSTGITSKCIITHRMFRTWTIFTLVNILWTVVAHPPGITGTASIYVVAYLWTRMIRIALTRFWTICSKRSVETIYRKACTYNTIVNNVYVALNIWFSKINI